VKGREAKLLVEIDGLSTFSHSVKRPWNIKILLPECPPDFEKTIALAFLKATYPQIPYQVHFTFKVPNPIYMFTSIE
jgi:hypothetical protein